MSRKGRPPQDLCLVQEEDAGRHYMPDYDELPRPVRIRLQQSSVNLCVECLRDRLFSCEDEQEYTNRAIKVIEYMERTYAAQCSQQSPLSTRIRRKRLLVY